MSLILSGTDGLSDVDGTAATPAIRGTDANTGIFFGTDIIGFSEGGVEAARINADSQFVAAAGTAALPVITTTGDLNTGIFFPAADTIAFSEGGAEAMRINASGYLGIGTNSPSYPLHVVRASGDTAIRAQTSGSYTSVSVQNATTVLDLQVNDGVESGAVVYNNTAGNYSQIWYNASGERMRLNGSGYLLVGTTDGTKGALIVGKAAPSSAYGQICAFSPTAADTDISGMSIVKYANNSTTAQVLFRFLINQGSAGQGQINANGASAAAFGSYSDARLKENIVDLPSQLANIMSLRPVEFDYIESQGGGHQIGFVAQEVKEIYPDLVGEDADGMYTLSDMNKNDARLIKAIQEMKAIIDTQASTITTLTARITALENK